MTAEQIVCGCDKFAGGDEEDRTPDLRIANATLSQLSYHPVEGADFTATGLQCAHERALA